MERKVELHIKIPKQMLDLIKDMASKHNCSVSDVSRLMLNNSIKDLDKSEMTNELELIFVKDEQKDINSKLYIVKNMYKRILDMAMSSYFVTGSINMGAINMALDVYAKAFNLYNDKIKTALGTDFKLTAKRLRNQNFLLQQSDTIKKLKLIEKR